MSSTPSNPHYTHTVFYHGKCPDGLGAAWAARTQLGIQAEYIPMDYGQPPPSVQGRHVLILDFSFPAIVLKMLEGQAESVVLLDHHASAQEMLANYECTCAKLHFDMTKSGARLAWEHFQPNEPVPPLIKYIEDRDLWNWKYPASAGFLRKLDTLGLTFEAFDKVNALNDSELNAFVTAGTALQEQFDMLCDSFVKIAQPITLDGQQGLTVATSPMFTSDVGNKLSNKCGTFACLWYVDSPTTIKVGLRSINECNVKDIAVRFGGGGHPNAAAFKLPISDLPALVAGQLESPMYKALQAANHVPNCLMP